MDEWVVFLLIALAIGLVIYLVRVQKRENQRREKLRALAVHLGYSFVRYAHPGLVAHLPPFQLFQIGRRRHHRYLMQGQRRRVSVTISQYHYTTGRGRTASTQVQTILLLQSGRLDLPTFSLKPEHHGHRIAVLFGEQDIDLPGQPLFSERYLLQGEDETAVRAAFDDRVVAYFLRYKRLSIEGRGDTLLIYRFRRRVDPEDLETFLEQGLTLLSRFARRRWEEPAGDSFLDEAHAALRDLDAEGHERE